MDSYPRPSTKQRFEIEIKRSRFITTVVPVECKAQALAEIELIRQEFPDANHHCWAMIARSPSDSHHQDQNDDGEPKGTAGKPMLNVLQHSGMGNLLAVVTRYFGGIKLGAGGLVRAYTQSVSSALLQLDTVTQYIKFSWQLQLPYSSLASLEHWLKSTEITVTQKVFGEIVSLELAVPASELQALTTKISSMGGAMRPGESWQQPVELKTHR